MRHCWHHDKAAGHVLAAEDLANALRKAPPAGIEKVEEINPSEFKELLTGKRGIVFFKDYWQRTVNGKKESFRIRSGDHIDLWDGSRITDWRSWARIHGRVGSFGLHSFVPGWSDLEDAKSVWFWRVV